MDAMYDVAIVGAGPAGLMAAKASAEMGLKVILIEKKKDFSQLRRACSSQFIMDQGYEQESLQIRNHKILFPNNGFEVNYSGELLGIRNKYYRSPKGYTIHFANRNNVPFAVKFDKKKLLEDLLIECERVGVEIRLGALATGGTNGQEGVMLSVTSDKVEHVIMAKKLIIAEGVNAHLAGELGFNQERVHYATAHTLKYFVKDVEGIEPGSWNLFYGKEYFSNAPLIIGPSLYGRDIVEVTATGDKDTPPKQIYELATTRSRLSRQFAHSKVLDVQGCTVKAYSPLEQPYYGNVLVIGDSAAFVEVEVQGALMCGFHAAVAVVDELNGYEGFDYYTDWWKNAFEFNGPEYLKVSQGYALVPTYSDSELDYMFSLFEGKILRGTYSQYKTPKLIWDFIEANQELIKRQNPELYGKIVKKQNITLSDSFRV